VSWLSPWIFVTETSYARFISRDQRSPALILSR
jgi:hypothetical protein